MCNSLMKIFALSGLFAVGVVCAEARQPNVVLFYADDFGWGDLSVNGGKILTPNMDRIFNEGVRFDNYTTHCVCSPSRGGLLTGRHYINIHAGPLTGGELDPEETTIAESFKAAGYATGAFGKWHNGAPPSYGKKLTEPSKQRYVLGHGVNAHGFDRYVGYYGGGPSYFSRYSGIFRHQAWYHDTNNMPDEVGYTTDLITKYALEFIEMHKDEPFFCYIPQEAMHNPLHAKYEDILRVPETVRNGTALLTKEEYNQYFLVERAWEKMPKEQRPIVRAAMLMSLDDSIGKVLGFLEQEGIFDSTIILFASDNGATPDGNNLPLRGGKHTLFEGGIHVPAAIWWDKGGLSGGRAYSGDFGYLDVYPTLCALAGVERLPGRLLDGRDLTQVIRSGKDNVATTHHWVWMREGATRQGRWKLIYNLEEMQLYDLKNDLEESENLAAKKPEMVKTFKATHEKWLKKVKCNPSYARPQVENEGAAAPEGDVLEFYAEQVSEVRTPEKGLFFIFTTGKRIVGESILPGDVLEYDICVAEDGRMDGFFYTPARGGKPHFLSRTGYDQFGRLQVEGPGPQGGAGVWEHRIVGIGETCPANVGNNIMCLIGREPGIYHFYLDNLVLRKANGRVITLWKDSSNTITRWHEEPFMMTPNHKGFKDVRLEAVAERLD